MFPSASLSGNIDLIRNGGADFLILLGDNYMYPTELHVRNLRNVLRAFDLPVFNAPGSHDLLDPETYDRLFGPTYYDFMVDEDLFVILNSEMERPVELAGEQLAYFVSLMNRVANDEGVRNVFIFSHKLIWARDDPRLSVVLAHSNADPAKFRAGSFRNNVLPLIHRVATEKPVFWISGDIGTGPFNEAPSLSLFYWRDPDHGVSFIATGLGDSGSDAIIRADVDVDGNVTFNPISLTGQVLKPLEEYGIGWWTDHFAGRPGPKPKALLITTIGRVLGAETFWLGAALSGLLAGLLWLAVFMRGRSKGGAPILAHKRGSIDNE